jgi:signal transduction histidine kinase
MFASRHSSRLRTVAIGLLIVVSGLASASSANAAEERQKTVLGLQVLRQESLPSIVLDSATRRALTDGLNGRLDYYAEYLDLARISDANFPAVFANYLARKYAGKTFDVVLALSPSVYDFLNQAGGALFPGVPVVYYATERLQPRRLTTGVVARLDLKGSIDVALQLHPDLQQVFVVSGASEYDKYYRVLAQTQLRPFDGRLAFTYLSGLSLSEVLQRAAAIPQRSIIYFLTLYEDADGNSFNTSDSLDRIAAVANRPIYVFVSVYMDHGAIGGSVLSLDVVGRAVADVALRVLKGEAPDRIPVHEIDPNIFAFDWRQLRRFGVNESRLPAGSIIQFRQPSAWEQYKWYVVAATTLLVLQTALIGGLVIQGTRRRRAEAAVRESASALRQSFEQNQGLAGRLINAQEEERRRIARDLHDDLSQQLASVSIMLSGLKQKVGKPGSASEVEQTIRTLQDRAATAAGALRTLSHKLHPGVLEHAGLVAALRGHCAEVAAHHHVNVSFSAEGKELETVNPDVALCVFRVTQEALTNAVRHGRAGTIRVELLWTPDATDLRVIDDGIGFVPGERGGTGLGLRSIDERVRLSRGVATLESQIGHGTTLSVRIPHPVPQHMRCGELPA